MPRVLRIINRFNLGGPTHNAAYLTRYLAPEFETLLVGGQWDASEEGSQHILDAVGVRPLILPEMRREVAPWRDRAAYRRIKELIAEFKPDIVHTHAAKAGAVGRMAAIRMKVPVIVHTFHGHVFHSYFGPVKTALYKGIERWLAARSTRIIAISEKQKSELVEEHRICAADKVRVIPLGFDLSRFQEDRAAKRALFRRMYTLGDDEVAIGIVGRLVPVKDHELFLRALKGVLDRTTRKVRAFIIGDGELRQALEARAAELHIAFTAGPAMNGSGFAGARPLERTAPLTFTSWLKEMDTVNAGLDIVALSSRNEGTPVTLIEAQAAGTPIVSTDTGGIRNVVLPGKTALLSDPGDATAFTENLLRLVEEPGLRAAMAPDGWPNVRDRFHFTRLTADMAALYRELLH